jgi:hypothetical protein
MTRKFPKYLVIVATDTALPPSPGNNTYLEFNRYHVMNWTLATKHAEAVRLNRYQICTVTR